MTYELKPHNPDHPYVRRFVGCGHGVLFTDYCKDCEIVSLQSTYKSAIRRVQACRDGLRRLGVALPVQTSLQSDVSSELRRLVIENETLRAGYDAARLEIEALRSRQCLHGISEPSGWIPIETAPKAGTLIVLGARNGVWVGKYLPLSGSGYRPDNPWSSMLLNHDHMAERYTWPTHWMPLPPPPTTSAGSGKGE